MLCRVWTQSQSHRANLFTSHAPRSQTAQHALCLLNGLHTQTHSRTHTHTHSFPFLPNRMVVSIWWSFTLVQTQSHKAKHRHTTFYFVFFKAEKNIFTVNAQSSGHRKSPNLSLMWFVYVFMLCLCVHARVLCILTDICFPQVKGVKTSGFCFNPNRRQMMFHQSLYLTVGVFKSVCLGCAATKNPTLSPNFRRTFSTDWANFSLEGHKLSLEVSFRARGLAECKFELRKNMCLYLMKWVCTVWVSEPGSFMCAKCMHFSLILSYFTQLNGLYVFHPCMHIVPVIDIARENTHVRLLIHFYKRWLSVVGFNVFAWSK